MKCQNCGEADATIHFKEVVDGNLREIHLCETCAEEKGFHLVVEQNKLSLATQFIWMAENLYPEGAAKMGAVQCETCGLRYSHFTRTGRLGCADCYEAFGAQLNQILRRVHGSTTHKGRRPGASESAASSAPVAATTVIDPRHEQLRDLRRQLSRAVEAEEYETAARLRDEIRALETATRGDAPGGPGAGGSGSASDPEHGGSS